jgi:hypothetical protein
MLVILNVTGVAYSSDIHVGDVLISKIQEVQHNHSSVFSFQ